jgi:uncharacterized protein (TIGR00369 family)
VDALMALSLAEAQAILTANFAPWVLDLNLRVEAVSEEGRARVRLPFSENLVRVGGTICGQALMTVADTVMVLAIAAKSGGFRPMTTVGQTISFMKPVSGVDAIVEARVLRLGKTLAFGEVALRADGREELVAHVTTTYAILGPIS